MNIIEAAGLVYDVPMSDGQYEPAPQLQTDDQWLALKAITEGRCAVAIDPSLGNNVAYLRAYLRGATATIDARLVLPDQLIQAEAHILLEFANMAAATVRRLRQLDQDLACVDEPWAE